MVARWAAGTEHRSAPIAVCSLGVRPCDLRYTFERIATLRFTRDGPAAYRDLWVMLFLLCRTAAPLLVQQSSSRMAQQASFGGHQLQKSAGCSAEVRAKAALALEALEHS